MELAERNKYWKRYFPEELEQEVQKDPVNFEKLRTMFFTHNITLIPFSDENLKRNGSSIYYGFCKCSDNPRYSVFVNDQLSYRDQIETFGHELCHVYYHCGCTGDKTERDNKVEDIIEREAMRLCEKDLSDIGYLLRNCPTRNE